MEIHFKNFYLEKLYSGQSVPGKPRYSEDVILIFKKRVRLLRSLQSTVQVRQYKSLHFEALKGDKKGLYSIRIDKKYRLEFAIEKSKMTLAEIVFIEDLSNHYR